MFKNTLFTKVVCITTIYAFCFAIAPKPATAQTRLAPLSFSEMYDLAHDGDVESLRASNYRGMNIDATNSSGDTGLCVAARRKDVHAYNSFRAAGANPYHPCTQKIRGYADFVKRDDVIGVSAVPQSNYAAAMAKEREGSRIAPVLWWIGGIAVAGGIIWLLSSGSHGGGGGGETDKEAYNSLGRNVATDGQAVKITSGVMKNDLVLRHSNENIEKIVSVDLSKSLDNTTFMDAILYVKGGGSYTNNENILLEAGPGTAAMNAIEASFITNSGYIKIDSYNASAGMVASEGSSAVNYGRGLIDNSCTDGIGINFSGYQESDTVVGMYADTKSTISNFGDILGNAISAVTDPLAENKESSETVVPTSASVGTIIGMEALIVNMGSSLNQDVINVTNYSTGNIYLSAGESGAADNEIKVSLIGMGSYLHNDFLNGSFNLNRAESVVLTNAGTIDLSYTGNYTASSATALRKGLGGIVGIRTDANSSALNLGKINITLEDKYTKEGTDVAAGMQSVHGGDIGNKGIITVYSTAENGRINYGMMAVEGSGNNSSLYSNINPTITNSADGEINILVSNSYGMASFVGGTLLNEGTIAMGSKSDTRFSGNIAMYGYGKTKKTDLQNTGTIDIYSQNSIAMQNDFAGGTDIINDGTINIYENAKGSYVFGGAYSQIHNNGKINYNVTYPVQDKQTPDGITYDPFKYYEINLGTSVVSSKARSIKTDATNFSSSTTEGIYNSEGAEINVNGSSFTAAMAVETNDGASTTQARAVNDGTINIYDNSSKNATNTIGMYMDKNTISNTGSDASLLNNGKIYTNSRFSIAMLSESTKNAAMVNNGTIQADHEHSAGMYATDYSQMINNKDILINGKESIGVYAGIPSDDSEQGSETSTDGVLKPSFINGENANIIVGSKDNLLENSYGVYAQASAPLKIENNGNISTYTKNAGAAIYTKGDGVKVTNNNNISIYGDKAYGVYTGGKSEVINETSGVITVGTDEEGGLTSGSIAIFNEGNETKINNKGDIHLYNNSIEDKNYAIYSTGEKAEIKNENGGNIYLHNTDSVGIYAKHGSAINDSVIDIKNDKSNAIEISDDANATNDSNGIINVGAADKGVNNSNGMVALDEATGKINNKGTINLWNDAENEGNSHAILAGGNITVTNETGGKINSYNDKSDVIRVTDTATVINSGDIFAQGNDVSVIQGYDDEEKNSKITVENTATGTITIGQQGTRNTEGYGIEANDINTIKNRGQITVHNKNSYGIYAKTGESITNDSDYYNRYGAKIIVTGEGGTGIYGGAVNEVSNYGTIELYKKNSKAISTSSLDENGQEQESEQTINNYGDLILHNADNAYGIYALGQITVLSTESGSIIIGYDESGEPTYEGAVNGYGIFAQKASNIENDSIIKIYGSGNGITGGEVITNSGSIYLHGDESKGISTNGVQVTNSGAIAIDGSYRSYGIFAAPENIDDSTTVVIENKGGGTITIGAGNNIGIGSHGIFAQNASSIKNSAQITVYAKGNNASDTYASGITGSGVIDNAGAIYVAGSIARGIYSDGTQITNNGAITIGKSQDSYGILAEDDTNEPDITNYSGGKIVVGSAEDCIAGDANCASNAHGIFAEKAQTITNYADIDVFAQKASGITGGKDIYNYSNNGTTGKIHVVGRESYGINVLSDNSSDASVYNEGQINIDDANGSFGIHVADDRVSTIVNATQNAVITVGTEGVTGTSAHGIYAIKASSISNEAAITVYAQGGNMPTVGPDDALELLANKASGITGNGEIINNGYMHITGGKAHGIYGVKETTSVQNSANIIIDVADFSYGIRTSNYSQAQVTNLVTTQGDNLTIIIGDEDNVGNNSHGIFAVGAQSIQNNAGIYIYAKGNEPPSSGDYATDDAVELLNYKASGITGGISIDNTGYIYVSGGNAHGIYGTANNTAITNSNNINIETAHNSYGIRAYNTAATSITNTGNNLSITVGNADSLGDSSHGIYAVGATKIENEANITVYAEGVAVEGYEDDALEVLNKKASGITGGIDIENSGYIIVSGGKAHGIYGAANNTAITNHNNIKILNAQDSYGIRAADVAQTEIINSPVKSGDDMSIIIGTAGDADTNAHGIYAKGSTGITNYADITIYAQESSGITGGKNIENYSDIHITGQKSKGLEIATAGSAVIYNEGKINVDKAQDSYGIYGADDATPTITNTAQGIITIGYDRGDNPANYSDTNGHGIFSASAQSINNNAEITVYSSGTTDGVFATGITGGATLNNTGKITITGNYGKALETRGTTINNSGALNVRGPNGSYGIFSNGSGATISNLITEISTPNITIGSDDYRGTVASYGIYAENATEIENQGDIKVYSDNSYAIYSATQDSQIVNNSGAIYMPEEYATGIYTNGSSTIDNYGKIQILKALGAYGINATGSNQSTSSITNHADADITIGESGVDALSAHGIYLDYGGTISNEAAITVYAAQSYGIYNSVGDIINNNAPIKLPQGNKSVGIFSNGSVDITNESKGTITIGADSAGEDSHGIKALNAKSIKNYAAITVNSTSSSTAISGGGAITNTNNLFVSGINAKGIYSVDGSGQSGEGDEATAGSSVTNSGQIIIPNGNGGYGIYATGNVSISNTNEIEVGGETSGNTAAGIFVVPGAGNSIYNSGDITVHSTNAWGINGGNVSSLENSGKIYLDKKNNVVGIFTGGEVDITNSGEIQLDYAAGNYGIRSLVGPANVTNLYAGKINVGLQDNYVDGDAGAYGIYVYNASEVNNAAEINVYAAESYGIYTGAADTIENSGPITIPYAQGSSGIYTTSNTVEVNNMQLGKIIIGGKASNATETGSYEISAGTDVNGIYAPSSVSVENGANITIYGQGTAITGHTAVNNSGKLLIDQTHIANNERASIGILTDGNGTGNTGSEEGGEGGESDEGGEGNAEGIINYSTGSIDIAYSNGSIGISTTGNADITNYAPITVGSAETGSTQGAGAYGIKSVSGLNIINQNNITVNADQSYGIYAGGATKIENSGNLNLQYKQNVGINSLGGSAVINNSGKINLATLTGNSDAVQNSVGISSIGSDSEITNQENGNITIGKVGNIARLSNSTSAYGIYAKNAASLDNESGIDIYADYSYAIWADATETIINNGEINIAGANSSGILSNSGDVSISNAKAIHIKEAQNSYGIHVLSGKADIQNEGSITLGQSGIEGNKNYGIAITEGSINNKGSITIFGAGNAIEGQYSTSIDNSGAIEVWGKGNGIHSMTGDIENKNIIQMHYNGSDGINTYSSGTVTNGTQGVINVGTVDDDGNILSTTNGNGITTNGATVTNHGKIVVTGDGHGINGASDITNYNGAIIRVYGVGDLLYQVTGSVINQGTLMSYNGNILEDALSLTNSGTIQANLFAQGTAYSKGSLIGAIHNVPTVINSKGGSIVNYAGPAIVGASTVTNSGRIEAWNSGQFSNVVTGIDTNTGNVLEHSVAAGGAIVSSGGVTITNTGDIVARGSGSGIYAVVTDENTVVNITNNGNISVDNESGGSGWMGYAGIKVIKFYDWNNEDSTTVSRGSTSAIYCDPDGCTNVGTSNIVTAAAGDLSVPVINTLLSNAANNALISVSDENLLSQIKLVNNGVITVNGAVDFGNADENSAYISVGNNGSYEAESFAGTLRAESSITQGGFDTTYVNENTLVGENKGVEFVSQSYMFDAKAQQNANGNTDVVMAMKPFENTVDDAKIANYLANNYAAQHGEKVFDVLKTASSRQQLAEYINTELGFRMIPNLAKQSLDIKNTIGRIANAELLDVNGEKRRTVVNVATYKNETKSKDDVTGYSDQVEAIYGFTDKKIGNNWRAGFGIEAIRADSDFNDGSSRYNNMVEVSAPVVFDAEFLAALVKPKAGFARGHYRRNAVENAYKADTKEYYYGIDLAAKKDIDLGWFTVVPQAEFDMTGLYIDDIKENNDGLQIDDKNVISAQSVLSLDAKKKMNISKNSAVTLSAGGKYIHEFGNKYKTRAGMGDMIGYYDIISNRLTRNYGILNMKAQFDYQDLSLDASANLPIDNQQKAYYLFNAKYKF